MDANRNSELSVKDPEERVMGASSVLVIAICFLVTLLDGLDTTSIGFVAPLLAQEWGVPPAALTPAFVATSMGAVIGYMICGPLAQRFGPALIGAGSVAVFAIGTLLTATAHDIATLSAWRFIAAIGLGGALPLAVSAAVQVAAPRQKEVVAMLVAAGLSAGGVIGGIIGGPLMKAFGWTSIFIGGGIVPLLVIPAFWRVLGRTTFFKENSSANTVTELFRQGFAARTAMLWLFAFLTFVAAYALAFWIPTLLTGFGFDAAEAPLGAAAFGAGGLIGSLIISALVTRWGIRTGLIAMTVVAMTCIAILSQSTVSPAMALPLIAGTGAGLIAGCVGQIALAVSLYPSALRPTGVGWAAASGRLGSIAGPAAGGALLSLGWPSREIILIAVVPAALAIATLVILGFLESRRARETAASANV